VTGRSPALAGIYVLASPGLSRLPCPTFGPLQVRQMHEIRQASEARLRCLIHLVSWPAVVRLSAALEGVERGRRAEGFLGVAECVPRYSCVGGDVPFRLVREACDGGG